MPKPWYDASRYGRRRKLARPPTSGTRRGNWISTGDSWGGPAKGAGNGNARRPFGPSNRAAAGRLSPDAVAVMEREERVQALHDVLYKLAFTARRAETQLQAAVHLLDRLEGRPAARKSQI